jgi:hypothetical protein
MFFWVKITATQMLLSLRFIDSTLFLAHARDFETLKNLCLNIKKIYKREMHARLRQRFELEVCVMTSNIHRDIPGSIKKSSSFTVVRRRRRKKKREMYEGEPVKF